MGEMRATGRFGWSRRQILIAGVGAATVGLLGACGDDGASAGGDGANESVPNPVKIGIGGAGSSAYTALYVAMGGGYLQRELEAIGTTFETVNFDGSIAGIQGVVSGNVPFVASVPSVMLTAAAEGAEIQLVSQFLDTDIIFLAAAQGQPTDPNNPAAIVEGKTHGIPQLGSGGHVTALRVLKSWGYDADSVKFVETGNSTQALGAIERGVADYYWVGTAGFIRFAKDAGGDGTLSAVLNLYDPETVKKYYGGLYSSSGLMGSPSFMQEHPKTTSAVVKALSGALAFIKENADNPEKIAEAYPAEFKNDDTVETLRWVAKSHSADGTVLPDAIERVAESLRLANLLKSDANLDMAALTTNDYR